MAINTNGQWIPDYPGQYPAQDPAYMNYLRQQTHAPQQQPAQQTVQPTAPTVYRADIIPVDDEQVVLSYFVQPGTSQMFMRKDNTAFYVKTAYSDGRDPVIDIFDKRPPQPPTPKIDPASVVTKDYLEQRLSSFIQASQHTPTNVSRMDEKETI